MKNKTELRTKIKADRQLLNIEEKSNIIVEKIRKNNNYISAKHVMLFYPMKYELNLLDLLEDEKVFYFPKVSQTDLVVCPNNNNFEKSKLNIMEPCSNPINPELLDLIIVPALAVDKYNYRLGYGGGFYDRFLAKYPNIKTLTPIFKEFIFDEIPHNNYDIKIDFIISG